MKFVALLIASATAIRLQDAPAYWAGPTWTYNHPSAAGFLQLSSCDSAGVVGVTCGPSDSELFATGMNGDEDLGQDITMKGEKFHYKQMVQLEGDDKAAAAPVPAPEKVSVLDPKICKTHTSFYGQK